MARPPQLQGGHTTNKFARVFRAKVESTWQDRHPQAMERALAPILHPREKRWNDTLEDQHRANGLKCIDNQLAGSQHHACVLFLPSYSCRSVGNDVQVRYQSGPMFGDWV